MSLGGMRDEAGFAATAPYIGAMPAASFRPVAAA
jgi:hypothetical protein